MPSVLATMAQEGNSAFGKPSCTAAPPGRDVCVGGAHDILLLRGGGQEG